MQFDLREQCSVIASSKDDSKDATYSQKHPRISLVVGISTWTRRIEVWMESGLVGTKHLRQKDQATHSNTVRRDQKKGNNNNLSLSLSLSLSDSLSDLSRIHSALHHGDYHHHPTTPMARHRPHLHNRRLHRLQLYPQSKRSTRDI